MKNCFLSKILLLLSLLLSTSVVFAQEELYTPEWAKPDSQKYLTKLPPPGQAMEEKRKYAASRAPDSFECSRLFQAEQGFSAPYGVLDTVNDVVADKCLDNWCTPETYLSANFKWWEDDVGPRQKFYIAPLTVGDSETIKAGSSDEHVGWIVYTVEVKSELWEPCSPAHTGIRARGPIPSLEGSCREFNWSLFQKNSPTLIYGLAGKDSNKVVYEECTKLTDFPLEIHTANPKAANFPGATFTPGSSPMTTATYKVDEPPMLLAWILSQPGALKTEAEQAALRMAGFDTLVGITPFLGTVDSFVNCEMSAMWCATQLAVDSAGDLLFFSGALTKGGAMLARTTLARQALGNRTAAKTAGRLTTLTRSRPYIAMTKAAAAVDISGNTVLASKAYLEGRYAEMAVRAFGPLVDISPFLFRVVKDKVKRLLPNHNHAPNSFNVQRSGLAAEGVEDVPTITPKVKLPHCPYKPAIDIVEGVGKKFIYPEGLTVAEKTKYIEKLRNLAISSRKHLKESGASLINEMGDKFKDITDAEFNSRLNELIQNLQTKTLTPIQSELLVFAIESDSHMLIISDTDAHYLLHFIEIEGGKSVTPIFIKGLDDTLSSKADEMFHEFSHSYDTFNYIIYEEGPLGRTGRLRYLDTAYNANRNEMISTLFDEFRTNMRESNYDLELAIKKTSTNYWPLWNSLNEYVPEIGNVNRSTHTLEDKEWTNQQIMLFFDSLVEKYPAARFDDFTNALRSGNVAFLKDLFKIIDMVDGDCGAK